MRTSLSKDAWIIHEAHLMSNPRSVIGGTRHKYTRRAEMKNNMGISPGFVPNASLLSITTSKNWARRIFKNWLGGDGSGCRIFVIQNFQYRRRDLASTVTKGEMNLRILLVIEMVERHKKRVRRDPGVRYGQVVKTAAATMMVMYETMAKAVTPMTTYAVVVSISQK